MWRGGGRRVKLFRVPSVDACGARVLHGVVMAKTAQPRRHVDIEVFVDTQVAIRHSCKIGWHKISVDTRTLTPEERDLLSSTIGIKEDTGALAYAPDGKKTDIGVPTPSALKADLKKRVAAKKKKFAEVIKMAKECSISTLLDEVGGEWRSLTIGQFASYIGVARIDDSRNIVRFVGRHEESAAWIAEQTPHRRCQKDEREDAERERVFRYQQEAKKKEDAKNKRRDAIASWLRERGHVEQEERFNAGVLPEKELADLVAEVLLDGFSGVEVPAMHRIDQKQMPTTFSASEWKQLKYYKDFFSRIPDTTVEPIFAFFQSKPHGATTARVTIRWHGIEIVRVFAL